MLIAAVKVISTLAREPVPQAVLDAYQLDSLEFGPTYIIPKPLDPRLIERVPQAVAQAAINSGAARIKP
jgi:malate dehydrogenase (oxaloacetate-decarboxylating)(NADP+)